MEFKKLSEVQVLETAAETAHVLVEEGGEVYRVPKTQVGGAGGVKTAIIRDSAYLDWMEWVISPPQPADASVSTASPILSYDCLNMTFEEAWETMTKGEPLAVVGVLTECGVCPAIKVTCQRVVQPMALAGDSSNDGNLITINFGTQVPSQTQILHWTADGIVAFIAVPN